MGFDQYIIGNIKVSQVRDSSYKRTDEIERSNRRNVTGTSLEKLRYHKRSTFLTNVRGKLENRNRSIRWVHHRRNRGDIKEISF